VSPFLRSPRVPVLGPSVPRAHGRCAAALGRLMMGLRAWTIEGDFPDIPKLVMAFAPHTSNWDFPTGLWVKLALRLEVRFVAKHTLFFWPLGPLLRWLGGIPVDRRAAAGFVDELSRELRDAGKIVLVVAPEGTRKRTEKWKSGFYRIAQEAGVPILLLRFDYPRRLILIGPLFRPSGDYESDLAAMRALVEPRMARRPENYA
jgi:1-acyl-sn-glycerol-3-phosphate acyltransferase